MLALAGACERDLRSGSAEPEPGHRPRTGACARRSRAARGRASAGSGLWRHKVAELGLAETARSCVATPGCRSRACVGAAFSRRRRQRSGRRGSTTIGARSTRRRSWAPTCWCWCAGRRRIATSGRGAARWSRTASRRVLPYAAERGVRLAIEPLHPMYAGDRSVVVTLAQANATGGAARLAVCRRGGRRVPRVVGPGGVRADRAGGGHDPRLPRERLAGAAAGSPAGTRA